MNLANQITVARVLMVPPFLFLLLGPIPYGEFAAAGLFILAAVTDAVDGYLARSRQQVTTLGRFLDPLADKLLVSAALIALVELESVPAWIAIVIISREFAVTGLRTIAASEGRVIAASQLGKYKTITQVIAVVALMIHDFPLSLLDIPVGVPFLYLALVMTLVSGLDYFRNAGELFRDR